jgi:phage tail-like protein
MTFRARELFDPLPGFRFVVAMSDLAGPVGLVAAGGVTPTVAGFSEVTGLGSTLDLHEYKEGGRNGFVHKFATRASFANITLKRGALVRPDLFRWYDRVRRGSFGARRSILVAHLGEDGDPALIWFVSRALPAKYVGPSWSASQSSVAVESLEIAHEGLELVPGSELGF